jgi:hypothetical protein
MMKARPTPMIAPIAYTPSARARRAGGKLSAIIE